jgi:hypothetical protein
VGQLEHDLTVFRRAFAREHIPRHQVPISDQAIFLHGPAVGAQLDKPDVVGLHGALERYGLLVQTRVDDFHPFFGVHTERHIDLAARQQPPEGGGGLLLEVHALQPVLVHGDRRGRAVVERHRDVLIPGLISTWGHVLDSWPFVGKCGLRNLY